MQYAAYYNLAMSDKAAREVEARRGSANTTNTPSSAQKSTTKTNFKKFLNQLRATEAEITPSGIYTPIIKQGPLFQGLKPVEKTQEPTPIYQRERPLFSLSSSSKKRGSASSGSSAGSA